MSLVYQRATLASCLREHHQGLFSFQRPGTANKSKTTPQQVTPSCLCQECSTVCQTRESLELSLEKANQEIRYRQERYETRGVNKTAAANQFEVFFPLLLQERLFRALSG